MNNTTFVIKLFLGLCTSIIFLTQDVQAQIVIGTPNLGFSQACANDSFNSYNVSFVFSPESALSSSNKFSLELSDASGSFTDSEIIYTSDSGAITTSPATINFSLPTTIAGEGYKLKIKSSAPVASSSGSVSFAAYYKIQDSPFTINNLIDTAAYCAGGSYLLTIDNPGTGTNDSPLNYPNLTFNWYRETSPTTYEFVSDGSSLSVSTPGTYFVETNYGSCTSNSYSNRVEITEATSGIDTTILSSFGNPFCPSSGPTTLSTTSGNSYQWYKDGEAILGATEQTYQTDESGMFEVSIDIGGCFASGSIDLVSEQFTSSINIPEENYIELDETLEVIITSSATSPEYQWFINDVLMTDVHGSSYELDEEGNYKVIITETTGCLVSKEFLFVVTQAVDPFPDVSEIPNLISPNGDGTNDTWIIPSQYVSGTNTEVIIMDSYGEIVLKTDDYLNNWPENELNLTSVNLVFYYVITTQDNKTKKGSITIVK